MGHQRVTLVGIGVSVALALSGCQQQGGADDILTYEDAPVSSLAALQEGVPDPSTLPEEGKADEVLPARLDLLDIQTPVRNQGHRGTCTIFATTALMESLYRAEGSVPNPDFSEQFLQWSVKSELHQFTTGAGSNPQRNLEAISQFGIVEESAWPYETAQWGPTQDPMCNADAEEGIPTRCYTNGEPPAAARSAMRFRLPAGRYLSPRRRSIMSYMAQNHLPVVVSGTFFYQAWNHGGSMLPVSSDYMRRGIVLYPNAADQTDSRLRPAGHGILLVGFDQEMRVQRIDERGQLMVDAMGQPVYETGFFLFKNSWGTSRFGVANSLGATGFGWISMRYVEEYFSAYVSGRPTAVRRTEICNNATDDDGDGRADCMDSDCSGDHACMDMPTATTNSAMPGIAIPDNSTTGASSTITVAGAGPISSLAVTVDVQHPYRGDLRIELVHAGRTVTLLDRQGAGEDDVRQTFSVADFNAMDAAGDWTLRVVDTARSDTGTLRSWSIAITRCAGGSCGGVDATHHYASTAHVAIPDATPAGASTDIVVRDAGTIRSATVTVDVTHPFLGDLTIRVSRVGGREFVLLREQIVDGTSLHRTFDVAGFAGEMAPGTYRLTVVDGAARDVGTLDGWSLDLTTH